MANLEYASCYTCEECGQLLAPFDCQHCGGDGWLEDDDAPLAEPETCGECGGTGATFACINGRCAVHQP